MLSIKRIYMYVTTEIFSKHRSIHVLIMGLTIESDKSVRFATGLSNSLRYLHVNMRAEEFILSKCATLSTCSLDVIQ